MEITLDKQSKTEGLIKIRLGQSDYQPGVEEKVRTYARKANLKGFRQGKVPTGVIKQMFGKSILVEEVNQLLSNKLSDYIKENKLRIIGEPLPNLEKANALDWESANDLEFEYQVGLVEDFTYDLSPKVKVKVYPIEVTNQVVEETLTDIRQRFGKITHPEISEPGDSLIGDLRSADGSFQRENVIIKTETLSKKYQDFFLNRKPEEEITLAIEEVFDAGTLSKMLGVSEEEAKQLNGEFTFKVISLGRLEPAELNTALFDRVFGKDSVTTEEEFLNKIKETIQQNYQRETDHFLDHEIEDYFITNTKINLPETFLKTWLMQTSKGELTRETIEKEFDAYLRSLKWDLIKNRIAEDNNITVESDEVRARAKELIISQFGGPSVAGQLMDKLDAIADNYLAHENGQHFMRLYNQLRHEKILKLIKEKITLTEKKVSLDEFRKMAEEHKH
ncbi:MAG: trigger factor [Cyclobacteriaceae bacterium]|nr:trigger factor [Cyclobacteriaceae bacterium]QOI96014.1 MAG: trigger factor [Flammeovirgaceae bacterium]